MICKADTPAAQKRYRAAFENGRDPVSCMLGSRLEAFRGVPGTPWQFYTGGSKEPPLALAVRGCSAWLAGFAQPDELELLLRVMGVDRLTVWEDTQVPESWTLCDTMQVFSLKPGSCLNAGDPPDGFQVEEHPGLWQTAQLVAQQPGFTSEAQDNFYADSCALVNRGFARIWAGELDGRMTATAGAYALWQDAACLAAIYTRPEDRHKQLGRALTARLTNHLCGEGFWVTLESAHGKENFYRALGFKQTGVTRRYAPPKE